jgi:hypothetical protein
LELPIITTTSSVDELGSVWAFPTE